MSDDDVAYITEMYGKMPTVKIALHLKIGLGKVWKNIKILKLSHEKSEKKRDSCNGFYNEKNFLLSLEVP